MYRLQKQETTEPTAGKIMEDLENMQAPQSVWKRLWRVSQEGKERRRRRRCQENVIYNGVKYCTTKKETAEAEEDTVVCELDGWRGVCLYNKVPYIPAKKNKGKNLKNQGKGVKYLVVAPRRVNDGAAHVNGVERKGMKVPQPLEVKGFVPSTQEEFLDAKTQINSDVWPFLRLYGVKKEDLLKLGVQDLKVYEEWSFGKQLKIEAEKVIEQFKTKKKEEPYEEKIIKVEDVLNAFSKTPFPALDQALKEKSKKLLRDDYSGRVQKEVMKWMKRSDAEDEKNSYWNSWDEQTEPLFKASFQYHWYAFVPNDQEHTTKLQDFYEKPFKTTHMGNHRHMVNVRRKRTSPDDAWRCDSKNLENKCCCCASTGPVQDVITKKQLQLKFRMTCNNRTGMWNSF